ncbi:MAG: hypothetical protein IJR89_06110 [Clostridia bacterium]|nr:hypothetical protein [Clostridia bacterium]
MKKAIRLALCCLLAFFLVSCSAFSDPSPAQTVENEPVLAVLSDEADASLACRKILEMIASDALVFAEFDDPRSAADGCRDRILASLLATGYSKYTGNTEKIAAAERMYPKLRISMVIPATDFENTVYTSFGGSKSVYHRDGNAFFYLTKIGGYTLSGQAPAGADRVVLLSVRETEHGYLADFYAEKGIRSSPLYTGVFVKREDASVYLARIRRIADAKIIVPSE